MREVRHHFQRVLEDRCSVSRIGDSHHHPSLVTLLTMVIE